MTTICRLDDLVMKFNIRNIDNLVDEAVALGAEYFKICFKCKSRVMCIFLRFSYIEECSGDLIGMSVETPSNTIVDNDIISLFKYSIVVMGGGESTVFYVTRQYSLGVYYLLCSETTIEFTYSKPIEPEEIGVFLESW